MFISDGSSPKSLSDRIKDVCLCAFLAISSHKVIFHVSGYSSVSSVSEFCLATQHNDEIKNSAVEGKSEGEVSNDAHDRAEPEITNNTI